MNSIGTTKECLKRGGKSLDFLAFLCWRLVVGIIFSGMICGGLCQDFHVRGEVEYKYSSKVYSREFEFSVKGTAWQGVIERKLPDSVAAGPVTLPNGKVMPGPPLNGRVPGEKIFENRSELTIMGAESLVEHYQYYRQRSYYLGEPKGPPPPGLPPHPPKLPGWEMNQDVTVYSGAVPTHSHEEVMPYLWLAFASRPYFEGLKTNMLVPFYHDWAGQWGRADFRQEAKWRLADTVPHLPVEVTYLNSAAKWERQLIFDRQFGTNWVLLVTEKFQTDKSSPATGSSPQQHQTTGDLFRDTKYCLYLTNHVAKTAALLWQRSFASAPKMKAAINPRDYDEHWKPNVIGVHVDPEHKKAVVVYSAEYSVWGDVVTFEEASVLGAAPPESARIFRPTPLNYTWPIASTRILLENDNQHIKVEFAFQNRETAEYAYTGVAWESAEKRERPNSTQPAVPKKVRLISTNEVIELEERAGTNRVVLSYTGIPEAEGWQMVSNAVAGTKTVPQYPFDRKYRLYVRSGDSPSKETVLWERPFSCESFFAATGKEQPATYMKLLCYHADPSFQRTIVFFKIMNTVFGEVFVPGSRAATKVAGTKPFMAVRELGWGSPPIAAVMVTPGNVAGTYSAALTLETGGVTNIVFDGQKWIPDRIQFK